MSNEWEEEPVFNEDDDDAARYRSDDDYDSEEEGINADRDEEVDSDAESQAEDELDQEEEHEEVDILKTWLTLNPLQPDEPLESTFKNQIENQNCIVISFQQNYNTISKMGNRFISIVGAQQKDYERTLKNIEQSISSSDLPMDKFVIVLYHTKSTIEIEYEESEYMGQPHLIPKCSEDFINVNKLNMVIDSNPSIKKRVKSIYVVQQEPINTLLNGSRISELFCVKQAFPSYNVSRVNGIELLMKIKEKVNKNIVERGEALLPLYLAYNCNMKSKLIYDPIIVNEKAISLSEELLWKKRPNGEMGIQSIIKHIQFGRDEKTKESWNRMFTDFIKKDLEPFKINPDVIAFVTAVSQKDKFKNRMDVYLNSLYKNLFFYEEIIKFIIFGNGNFARKDGSNGSVADLNEFKKRIKMTLTHYFKDVLSEDDSLLQSLIEIKKVNMNLNFYFPNVYEYDYSFHNFMIKKYGNDGEVIINTLFYTNHYLDSLMGECLSEAVKQFIGIKSTPFILNDTIISKMIEIMPKLLLFLKDMPNRSKSDMFDLLYVILECDDFNSFNLPIQTISDLMSKLKMEPIPFMSELENRDFLSVVYHYALYTYQFGIVHKIVKESDIKMYLDKVKLLYETKPIRPSDLFPHQGLNGSIMESFLEFSIMYADLLAKDTIDDPFLNLLEKSLYSFTGIKKINMINIDVSWLTNDFIVSCYRLNQINISREDGENVRKIMLFFLSSLSIPNNQKLFYKFVNQFTGRKNVLPPPNDQNSKVIEIKADYDFSLLLQEQIELRVSHPSTEEPHVRAEQREIIINLLNKPLIDEPRIRFILLNRLNQLECILQGGKPRKSAEWPELDSQLTASEQTKSDSEKQVILFELHKKRNVLLLNQTQVTHIHLELLQLLKKKTNEAFSLIPTLFSEFNDAVITTFLKSMGRYDMHHSFLFYSIMNRCIEVSEPGMAFTFHPETMLLNEEQDTFLRDLVYHAKWMVDINVFESNNPYYQLLKQLFIEEESKLTPLYHIVQDIDSYYPFTVSNWLLNHISERNQQMKLFIKQQDQVGSVFHSWVKTIPNPVLIIEIMNKYKNVMMKQFISPQFVSLCDRLISKIDSLLKIISIPAFILFMNELRQNVIRRRTVAKFNPSILESDSIADIEMMISHYSFGTNNNILSKLLFVYPYELEMSPLLKLKSKTERMIQALRDSKDLQEDKKECESCVLPIMNRAKKLRKEKILIQNHLTLLKKNPVTVSNRTSINQVELDLYRVNKELEDLAINKENIRIREAQSRLEKLQFVKSQLDILQKQIKVISKWSEDTIDLKELDSEEFDVIQFGKLKDLINKKNKSGELPGVFDRYIKEELNLILSDLEEKLEKIKESQDIAPDGTIPQQKIDEAQQILTDLKDKSCTCLTRISEAQEAYQKAKGTDQEEKKFVELNIAEGIDDFVKNELKAQIELLALIEQKYKEELAEVVQDVEKNKNNISFFNKVFNTISKNIMYLPLKRLRDAFTFLMEQKNRVQLILNE